MTAGVRRIDQRLIRRTRTLRTRHTRVNGDSTGLTPPRGSQHIWACQGCGGENSPAYLSCRTCETLKWGVCP